MKSLKKAIYTSVFLSLLLTGCQPTSTTASNGNSGVPSDSIPSENTSGGTSIDPTDPDYYSKINERTAFNMTNALNFNDDIKGGLDNNVWYALDGGWHTDDPGFPHNGVRKRNLFYVNEGNEQYLAIKGRGYYNEEDTATKNLPEGGVIVSKNHLTPGRYEIEMAAHPREGAVTAMWTYCTETGNEATSQNEIDIEIGGLTRSNHFEHLWSSAWTKKTTKETKTPKVSDQLFLNDGQIHKYTFDWYTNYPGTNQKRVDWFIDEVYITSITGNVVPEHSMPLWVGVWFPPRWAGNPSFVEDYLLVKNISFTAFELKQWYEDCRSQTGYTKVSVGEANIQTIPMSKIKELNKINNPTFESLAVLTRDNTYYGWEVDTASKGTTTLSNEKVEGSHSFALTASDDQSGKYNGQYLKQTLSNSFEGYRYNFSIYAKKLTEDSVGNIEIYFRTDTGSLVDKIIIPITSLSFSKYSQTLELPAGTQKLEIDITAETKTVLYDNAELYYLGN